jgi:hypothetical protein
MKRAYFTRVFDNIGFKCKIICHLKISAKAGIQVEKTGFRIKSGMTNFVKTFLRQYTSTRATFLMGFFFDREILKPTYPC